MKNQVKSTGLETIAITAREHCAVNNIFLTRFAKGDASREEVLRYAQEFYHFVRSFPGILCILLKNTVDEDEIAHLQLILNDELGNGDPSKSHEVLYQCFLLSMGLNPSEITGSPMLPSTGKWIDTLRSLYSSKDSAQAMGASFGLEHVALRMFEQIIAGLEIYKERWFPEMNMKYFVLHREIEASHENATENIGKIRGAKQDEIRRIHEGMNKALSGEARFFAGLAD